MQLLAQRDHSSYELTRKLTLFFSKKIKCAEDDYPEQLTQLKTQIEHVIKHCTQKHWMDDEQYIEKYIFMRANKGYGKYKISLELKQRGLSSDINKKLLNIVDINWSEIAYQQLLKKFKVIDSKNNQQKQKVVQFLTSRGFTQNDIKTAYSLLT
ncbi:regulatory protein RecX [Gilliamella sp. B14384H2]|uniref:regulatory protein RecX n=1 Tax=unclassified Gilliamella TaxID=2685620 RepID=UPI0018DB431B|nr:regulatory protein RecX [Gilliamella sp. B14384G10]MBI0039103.1 regulatory protein RecX [Gilliamella sp. B14384G7]MBI0051238.1 regulatory protein RecX [Gilliamella sp. B14384G13]MBI0053531.1 regulatory protein RecX [Gilliamella sp. B14384H2]